MPATSGPVTLAFGPPARGAPDDLRALLAAAVDDVRAGELRVLTQQLSDRGIVDAVLAAARRGVGVRAMGEEDYLRDRGEPFPADPWAAGGRNERARNAFTALLRADVAMRLDHVGSGLLHSNFVAAVGSNPLAAVTTANLTPGSFDQHHNTMVVIRDVRVAALLERVFTRAWDGDYRDASGEATVDLAGGGACWVRCGARGTVAEAVVTRLAAATTRIRMAMFTFAVRNQTFDALEQAVARGVAVEGVVDADQSGQVWDAVPVIRGCGADVRYHPGALTGGLGRMHHKLFLVDDTEVIVSTANLSQAADDAHETVVVLHQPSVVDPKGSFAGYAAAELDRLAAAATVDPPPRVQR